MQRTSGIFLAFLAVVNAFKFLISSRCSSPSTESSSEIESSSARNVVKYSARSRGKRLRLREVEGAMRGFEALTDSFLGGTVGVMSVAFLLEVRKVADERLDGCPYCMGNGEILCASCYGTGDGAEKACDCKFCYGRGLVKCINCKGDGRITPILLQSKAVRDPDYATDNIGSGINGA